MTVMTAFAWCGIFFLIACLLRAKVKFLGDMLVPCCLIGGLLGCIFVNTTGLYDEEDRLRIRRHLDNRAGLGFQTVECGTDILSSLSQMEPDGAVLLDSVTALLSNEMFRADGTMDAAAPARLETQLLEFSRRMRCCVFVSDFIYADGGQYDDWTEGYRRGLAQLDRALAAACENAAELCCAQAYWYKGGFSR